MDRKKGKLLYLSLLLSLLLLLKSVDAFSQSVVFNPDVNDTVFAITKQPDGKIFIAGNFTSVAGIARNRVARLNMDGSLDLSFDTNPNRGVSSLALQTDGKILIGGSFTIVGGATGFLRNRIARLNADGSVDSSFNPDANGTVDKVLLQPDGKILIVGRFTKVAGIARNRVARLNSDGSLDSNFNPDANDFVYEVSLQANGKILIAGRFTKVADITRNRVARLNSDGSLDASFVNPGVNDSVLVLAVQDDGSIIIGGEFRAVGQYVRLFIARLNNDGSLDISFNPIAESIVFALALQNDGNILVGGGFTEMGQYSRNRLARLNTAGDVEASFDPNVGRMFAFVRALFLQGDGQILVGGSFSEVGVYARNNLARIGIDGSIFPVQASQCFPIKASNGSITSVCL